MKLNELLEGFLELDITLETPITGLKLNSQNITKGDVFFAVKGKETDGRAYLDDAIQRGAVALVVEADGLEAFQLPFSSKQVVIPIKNLQKKISAIAGRFYGNPSHELNLIGSFALIN